MTKDEDYVYENRNPIVFGKEKSSPVVNEVYAQEEIDKRTRD